MRGQHVWEDMLGRFYRPLWGSRPIAVGEASSAGEGVPFEQGEHMREERLLFRGEIFARAFFFFGLGEWKKGE